MLLKHKTSIITGCNRGIGSEILKIFSKNGSNIFACCRKSDVKFLEDCKSLSDKFEINIFPVFFDLSNREEIKNAANQIIDNTDSIDVLVNNSGIIQTSLFQMTSIEKIEELFNINLFSQLYFTQCLLKKMIRKKSGSIINIATSSVYQNNIGRSSYAASKAAMITFAKVMSKELASFGIRVNSIAPGAIDTDMLHQNTQKNFIESTIKELSLKRIGKTEEVANVALFLASEMSSYITGQVIRVDGGM